MNTLLPYFITGPPLYKEAFNSSCQAISDIIHSSQYGFPEVCLPIIDVRDLALMHILTLYHPQFKTNGRYLTALESKWFSQIIDLLKKERLNFGQDKRIKTKVLPQWILMVGGLVNPRVKQIYPFLHQNLDI